MNRSGFYFDEATVKACVMSWEQEEPLVKYAQENCCPRCNAPTLRALGQLETDRGPIGILVCRDCEFGVYLESTAAVDGSADQKRARDILVRNASSLNAEDVVELERVIADNERLLAGEKAADKLIESQVDSLAHFGECLEAVQGAEEFSDLVLRLMKDRDRLQEALVFYARPEHWSEPVPDREIEQNGSHTHATLDAGWKARDAIGPQAIGMKAPAHPGLDIVEDKPAELVVAARILARALDRTVYLTKMRTAGGLDTGDRPWTITIEKDGYGSEVAIKPDGSAKACDVWT